MTTMPASSSYVQDLSQHSDVPSDESLSDVFLATLSTELGVEWDRFGLFLGFRQAQIDQLREAYPRNVSRCIRLLLIKWRDSAHAHGDTCLLQKLESALRMSGRNDLADSLASRLSSVPEEVDVVDGEVPADCLCQPKTYVEEIEFGDADAFRTEHDNITSQTRHILEQTRRNKGLYVMTKGWCSVRDEFLNRNFVTISGNAGSGKTSLAIHILLGLFDKGYTVMQVSSPQLIEKLFNPDKGNTIFFCDDAFGAPEVNGLLTDTWLRLHDKIISFLQTGNFGLILTTRKQVLNSCRLTFSRCDTYVGNIQDLDTFKLTVKEKKEIFVNHCQNKNLHLEDICEVVKETAQYSNLTCFPLLCKLYSADQNLHRLADFFHRPLPVLVDQIRVLATRQPLAYCGLLMILMHDGSLPKTVFDVFNKAAGTLTREQIDDIKEVCRLERTEPLTKILDGLESITNVYVDVDDDSENFVFIHDSVFDAISYVFGLQFPNRIIEICSPMFLHRRVRCSGMKGKCGMHCNDQGFAQVENCNSEFPEVIYIPKGSDKLLAKRFVVDIMNRFIYEVFDNPSITDNRIAEYLVSEINDMSQEEKEKLWSIRDRSTNRRMMHCIAERGYVFLAESMLAGGCQFDTDSLLRSCIHGNVAMIDFYAKAGLDLNRVSKTCGRSAVHIAAALEDDTLLRHLIQHGVNIHTRAEDGVSAITMAARRCSIRCLKLLLEHNADVNVVDGFNRKPIHYAAGGGEGLPCVKRLVEAGADPLSNSVDGYMPIHFAAECQPSDCLKYLLGKGADPNSQNKYKKRPLHYAGKFGIVENIKLLLKHGAEVEATDTKNRQALHEFCAYGTFCKKTMDLLTKDNLDAKDYKGMTPLHISCWQLRDKGLKKAEELVTRGSNVSAIDYMGMRPLMYAILNNSPRVASFLVSKGADPNCKGHNGMTCLHLACLYGNTHVVRQFLDMAVDVDSYDDSGYTPLSYARFKGFFDIEQILLGHGADPEKATHIRDGQTPFTALRKHSSFLSSSSMSLSSLSSSLSSSVSQ